MGKTAAETAAANPAPRAPAPPKLRQRYTVSEKTHPHDAERLFNLGLLDDKQIGDLCRLGILVPPAEKLDALRARGVQVDPVKVDDPEATPDMETVPNE
jgi:hypothetical protein